MTKDYSQKRDEALALTSRITIRKFSPSWQPSTMKCEYRQVTLLLEQSRPSWQPSTIKCESGQV